MTIRRNSANRIAATIVAVLCLLIGHPTYAESANAKPYAFCDRWINESNTLNPDFVLTFPGTKGWLYSPTDFSPMHVPTDRDIAALARFVDLLNRNGTRLVLVIPPPRGLVESSTAGPVRDQLRVVDDQALRRAYQASLAALRRSKAIIPDLLAAVDKTKFPEGISFYRKQDTHWRAEGARLSAETVAAEMKRQIDLSKLPHTEHKTSFVGPETYRSLLVDALEKKCGPKVVQREQDNRYVTTSEESSSDGGDLLGSSATPVVLVGTSFSRPDAAYNFAGFLSDALDLDVLNVAIPGGALATSMLSYIGSEDFTSAPPAILVWELRPYQLPDEAFLGQVLATVSSTCTAAQTVVKQEAQLQRGMTPVLTLSDVQRNKFKTPLVLDMAVGETGVNKYVLRMSYTDFSKEDVEVDLTRASFAPSHFFHTLPLDRLRRLESISLRPAARLYGTVSVSLCPVKRAS